ncbi:MAG: hypothetical protein P1V34_16090 [Alphaproteobacteria bacterium]|nr:hypothetical protein [Alphaproteobacteria bacterium]
MDDLDFVKAPRENLDTWEGTKKLGIILASAAVIILSGMAIFLT